MREDRRCRVKGIGRIVRLVVFAAGLSTGFVAAGAHAASPDLDFGLVVPGLTGALAEDSLAGRENPAGLGFLEGGELQLVHLRAPGARSTGLHYGLSLGPLGAGFAQEWLDGSAIGRQRRSQISLALGDRSLALGASTRWLRLAGEEQSDVSYDLGLAGRVFPYLAWSVRARDIGLRERTSYSTGIGLRALRDRITIGVDRVWSPDEAFTGREGLLSGGLELRLYDGLGLRGQIIHPLDQDDDRDTWLQAAVVIDLPHLGFSGGHLPRAEASDNLYAGIRLSTARHRTFLATGGQVFVNLEDFLTFDPPLLLPAAARDPLLDLIRLLDQARRDPEVDGVVIRTSGGAMLSLSEVEELRHSLSLLQENGKTVYFYLDGADDWTLYLAAGADRVIAAPSTAFLANGLTSTVSFLGEGLGKIGVNPEFVRAGEYKTAPDTLERSDISEPHREAIESVLDDTWQRYSSVTADGRELTLTDFEKALSMGIYAAGPALDAGLIDEIAFPDQIEKILQREGESPRIIKNYETRRFAQRRWGRPPIIAVIPIVGTIVRGETPIGPFSPVTATGAATVNKAIARALDDPRVSAIVLRIDSPGGEAQASDLIRRAVEKADEEKPVVAAMGSVAASGGYYAALGARRIFATSSTITGSIGVFAGSVDLSGLFEKIGVNQVVFKRGELADIFALNRPWTQEERLAVGSFVDAAYADFVTHVSEARGISPEKVEEVAGGRIWTGFQAAELELIDGVATFQEAVEHAKIEAGIAPEEVVDVSLFAGVTGPLAAFTGRGRPLAGTLSEFPKASLIDDVTRTLGPFIWIRANTPLALLPWTIEIR